MKPFLLPLFLLVFYSSFSQERNSESRNEQIDFSNTEQVKSLVSHFTNINRTTGRLQKNNDLASFRFISQKIPVTVVTPFVSFFCSWRETNNEQHNTSVSIRFSSNNIQWDEWIVVRPDEHVETSANIINQLQYIDTKYKYYQLHIVTNQNKKGDMPEKLFLNFFSPGEIKSNIPVSIVENPRQPNIVEDVNACTCTRPDFVTRVAWGCTQTWAPSSTTVSHLIVHHAAGTNTATDWGAVVLAIWNFHTTTVANGGPGFSDIGYNWLIAPTGVLYEGRYKSSTDDVSGAHFCGTNSNTMGVCMLGNYTSQTITAEARNTLIKVLAWKACEKDIDVIATSFHAGSGQTINNISGHRQGVCATECPGNTFFPDLPGIRTSVKNYQDNGCTLTSVININGLEDFSVLPNPVTKSAFLKLKLNTAKQVQYRVLGTDGKIIYSSAKQLISGSVNIEIKELQNQPPGNYLLQVFFNDAVVTKKLVKQ